MEYVSPRIRDFYVFHHEKEEFLVRAANGGRTNNKFVAKVKLV